VDGVALTNPQENVMTVNTWLLYLAAAIGLSITPGPNSLLVLTHGALHGHRRTLYTVAGGALGFGALIGLSVLGIGALLQASAGALTVLKLVGGVYLVWLGVQLWRAPAMRFETAAAEGPQGRSATLFRQGLLTALSNPKALLFYGAFLPQLIDPKREVRTQLVAIAVVFISVEIVVEYALALLAHRVRPWLSRMGRRFNKLCGGMFVGIGVAMPLTW
jgi:homoserine/homoserine lactone efflux protein